MSDQIAADAAKITKALAGTRPGRADWRDLAATKADLEADYRRRVRQWEGHAAQRAAGERAQRRAAQRRAAELGWPPPRAVAACAELARPTRPSVF